MVDEQIVPWCQVKCKCPLESEKIVTMWPTNDIIDLTRKGSRGVGAKPPFF